jgi:hypothetical protein
VPSRLEKSPERRPVVEVPVGTLEILSTPCRFRPSWTFTFQREFFRFTFVCGIMMGPPTVNPPTLFAVAALAGATLDAEANEYGRAFSAEFAKL